jgi:hypothetical protein
MLLYSLASGTILQINNISDTIMKTGFPSVGKICIHKDLLDKTELFYKLFSELEQKGRVRKQVM